jgi:hypothetical protein
VTHGVGVEEIAGHVLRAAGKTVDLSAAS